jgi:hypothetical protein
MFTHIDNNERFAAKLRVIAGNGRVTWRSGRCRHGIIQSC